MRRVFGIAAAATLALSVAAFAQDTKKPPAEHTMTGCLQKGATAGVGLVQNTAEKGPKTISIVESKDNLAPPRKPKP